MTATPVTTGKWQYLSIGRFLNLGIKQKQNNAKHYFQEILWDNKYFQTQGLIINKKRKKQTMFCPKWYKAGVIRLGHLRDGNDKKMDFKDFTVKFNINCNILFYYNVIKAIPKDLLIAIEQFVHQNQIHVGPDLYCYNIECYDFAMNLHKAATKSIYKCCIKFKYQTAVALKNGIMLYRQSQIGTKFSNFLIFVQGTPSYKHYDIVYSTVFILTESGFVKYP